MRLAHISRSSESKGRHRFQRRPNPLNPTPSLRFGYIQPAFNPFDITRHTVEPPRHAGILRFQQTEPLFDLDVIGFDLAYVGSDGAQMFKDETVCHGGHDAIPSSWHRPRSDAVSVAIDDDAVIGPGIDLSTNPGQDT